MFKWFLTIFSLGAPVAPKFLLSWPLSGLSDSAQKVLNFNNDDVIKMRTGQ